MEYLIGLVLALAVAGLATSVGFDRDRSFAPTVLIVIASYYVLFALMAGGSGRTLLVAIFVGSGFLLLGVLGFKRNLWLTAAALVGHGVFDFIHHWFINNPGVLAGGPASVWRLMYSLVDGWRCYCCGARIHRSSEPLLVIRTVPMRVLELKIPPVAVVLVTALLMWLSSWAVPTVGLVVPGRDLVALGLAIAGAVTSILGVASFRRVGTTVNPLTPDASSTLVRSGVYTLTRNPMYLGFLMLLLAWGIYVSNAVALLFIPVFVVYMNRFQIEPEERALRSRFGQTFVAYTTQVRRWI